MIFKGGARLLIAVAIGILGVTAPVQAASKIPASGEKLRIYIVNDQSVVDAIINQSAQDPAYATKAASFVERWRKGLNSGKNPNLPGLEKASAEQSLLALDDLKSRLSGLKSNRPSGSVQASPDVITIKMVVTVNAVDRNNANTYPIRGAKDTSGFFWKMTLWGEAVDCDDACEISDRYTANLTINPGTNSTRINGSNLYFPNSGGFTRSLLQISAVCNGVICGRQTTGTLPSSSSDVINNYGDRHGKVLTIGVALMLYHGSSYIWDAGKTHDCSGQGASVGNGCKYSY